MNTKEIYIDELPLSKGDLKDVELIKKQAEDEKLTATIHIKADKRKATIKEEFVIAYTQNLRELAELKISPTELKIIAYILEIMEFGNLICLSQKQMSINLGISKTNISYHYNKLKDKGILIEKDGHTYMNSKIFQKGLTHSLKTELRDNLKLAQGNLKNEEGEEIKLVNTL